MWIILFLVCFQQSTSSFAQELNNFDRQIVVDSSELNQGVKWDSTRPPVTLTIRSGRSDRINRTQDAVYNDDRQLFYSNQWQPVLMPITFNNQRDDPNKYQTDNRFSLNYPFVPTFLKRPDSDQNRTEPSEFPYPSVDRKDAFPPTSVPMAPVMFYPPPFSFYPNSDNQGFNVNAVQNYSTSVPGIETSESATTNIDESQSESSQTVNFPLPTDISRRFYPDSPYRNAEGFQLPRYIPPYSFSPFPGYQPFQPIINPYFNRQLNSGRNIPPVDVSQVDAQINSDLVRDNEAVLEDNVSRGAPTNIAPVSPFSFPGYPYGLAPPLPFAPPFIPNIPPSRGRSVLPSGPLSRDPFIANFLPRGVPFNALFPPSTNIPPSDAGQVLPAPILEGNPTLEPSGILPQVGDLQPEVPAELKAETENLLENERPNVGKIPYAFGFDMTDGQGNDQHRKESSDGSGAVTGSYGYRDLLGFYRLVNYIADKDGFRAFIKSNEPGVANSGSANVVVMAESPPPKAILEGLKASEPQPVIVPDEPVDLIPAGSEPESK